jgi:hypothetical protein
MNKKLGEKFSFRTRKQKTARLLGLCEVAK